MFEVVITQLNQPNKNGVTMSREVVSKFLAANAEFSKKLRNNALFGYVNPSFRFDEPERICCVFKDVFISDGYVLATAEPYGEMQSVFQDVMENKQTIGFDFNADFEFDPNDETKVTAIKSFIGFSLVNRSS